MKSARVVVFKIIQLKSATVLKWRKEYFYEHKLW